MTHFKIFDHKWLMNYIYKWIVSKNSSLNFSWNNFRLNLIYFLMWDVISSINKMKSFTLHFIGINRLYFSSFLFHFKNFREAFMFFTPFSERFREVPITSLSPSDQVLIFIISTVELDNSDQNSQKAPQSSSPSSNNAFGT